MNDLTADGAAVPAQAAPERPAWFRRPWPRDLLLLFLFALALRLPFLNQAFQLDDPYYLAGARYVQHDPAHPWRTSYVFLGQVVNMRGHPHPPLNVWALGLVLKVVGQVSERPFHVAYLVWTLLAVTGAYWLARRFTNRPKLAALLFLATPALVVHGNALESDIPFLALWLAAAASFVWAVDRESLPLLAVSGAAMALASLAAYQSVVLGPVLALYLWTRRRWWKPALLVCVVPWAMVGAWQLYQRLSDGALPAAVLMGHLQAFGMQSLSYKLKNAQALTGHLAWLVFPGLALAAFEVRRWWRWGWVVAVLATVFLDPHPVFAISFATGFVVLVCCVEPLARVRRFIAERDDSAFLRLWILVFFAAALVIFFAGAARYLLPIAAPVMLLTVRALDRRPELLIGGLALQLAFSLGLATAHYQHSNSYRGFVRQSVKQIAGRPAWVNGEWGLHYYALEAGARPLLLGQVVQPGEWVISNQLGYPVPVKTAGGELRTVTEWAAVPTAPLRLISLNGGSAFSTISFGVRPFGITNAPADVLRLEKVDQLQVKLEHLTMNDPQAARQFVSGLYELEAATWRWTEQQVTVLLKRPAAPARLTARLYLPEAARARKATLSVDGQVVAEAALSGPGMHTVSSGSIPAAEGTATVTLTLDQTFSPPGDARHLGVILHEIGFRR